MFEAVPVFVLQEEAMGVWLGVYKAAAGECPCIQGASLFSLHFVSMWSSCLPNLLSYALPIYSSIENENSQFPRNKIFQLYLGIWKSQQIVILEDGTTLCFYPSTLILHMMMYRQKTPICQEASVASGPVSLL